MGELEEEIVGTIRELVDFNRETLKMNQAQNHILSAILRTIPEEALRRIVEDLQAHFASVEPQGSTAESLRLALSLFFAQPGEEPSGKPILRLVPKDET